MFSVQELRFARNYPFSSIAKKIVKDNNFSLDNVPDEVISRAKVLVLLAAKNSSIPLPPLQSKEILTNEILAFPVAKILVSLMKKEELERKFISGLSSAVKNSLDMEGDDALFSVANELGVNFHLAEQKGFFAEMPVSEYLKAQARKDYMKLVNQNVSRGKVLIPRRLFTEFIASVAEQQLSVSMPKGLTGIPSNFQSAAKELKAELVVVEKKFMDNTPLGNVKPEHFPPCIARIYSDMLQGKNLNHAERFNIATFMVAAGMPAEQIIELYRNTPNFDRKVTTYQVMSLSGKQGSTKYSAASCSKMAEYGLRQPDCPCNTGRVKHPMQHYRREVLKGKKQKNPGLQQKNSVQNSS